MAILDGKTMGDDGTEYRYMDLLYSWSTIIIYLIMFYIHI